MRKLLFGLFGALLIAALLYGFRAELSMRVVERIGAARMTTDAIAELPDGLHLALCGAGAPLPDPARSGPCVAVIAGSSLFVVDAGTNGARNLQRMGLPAPRVAAVFLTHFHSDHIDGLGELMLLRWTGGAHTEAVPVYGPPGVAQVVSGFNLAYRLDAGYRTAHHGTTVAPPSGAGGRAVEFEPPAPGKSAVVWDDAGVVVTAFNVDHQPVSPAVGYRFDYGGRSLVISGDTRKTQEMVRVSKDVDLLVHEALAEQIVAVLHRNAVAAGQDNVAQITDDILSYHTTPVEAAEIAEAAGVRHLLLYHIIPPLLVPGMEAAFLEGVSDRYSGPVTVGRDGTFISLPAGSEAVRVSNWL